MDLLDELPSAEDRLTPKEDAILDELFGPSPQKIGGFSKIRWKVFGCTVLLFVLLANPWIDSLICNLPYCGGSRLSSLIVKVIVFSIALAVLTISF